MLGCSVRRQGEAGARGRRLLSAADRRVSGAERGPWLFDDALGVVGAVQRARSLGRGKRPLSIPEQRATVLGTVRG